MVHPIFRLLLSQPHMLAEHAQAYADLVSEEADAVVRHIRRRALLHVVSVLAAFLALTLASIGGMLWAALPPDQMRAPWALALAPALAAAVAAWAHLAAASNAGREHGFKAIREQFAADAAMLKSASES